MSYISTDVHIYKEDEINYRVSKFDNFGTDKYFASLHLENVTVFFNDVQTIDKVITELKKARKGLAKVTESGVL